MLTLQKRNIAVSQESTTVSPEEGREGRKESMNDERNKGNKTTHNEEGKAEEKKTDRQTDLVQEHRL
jgi:hypothetical protein